APASFTKLLSGSFAPPAPAGPASFAKPLPGSFTLPAPTGKAFSPASPILADEKAFPPEASNRHLEEAVLELPVLTEALKKSIGWNSVQVTSPKRGSGW
ncbi:MAG: hypothetical protein KDI14_10835, partial [Halioglobus sp.]|nr:hypothetical protein [Halioglobus sp.]